MEFIKYNSPGDGACFYHSIVSSGKEQGHEILSTLSDGYNLKKYLLQKIYLEQKNIYLEKMIQQY